MKSVVYIATWIILSFTSCSSQSEKKNITSVNEVSEVVETQIRKEEFNYDLSEPSRTLHLPYELVEVSGLEYHQDRLLAINDEKGRIYSIDTASGKVIEVESFWDAGDYEGIAVKDNTPIIINSAGNIYVVKDETREYKTSFSEENDLEGVTFDPKTNSLLLVTKRKGLHTEQNGVYRYDMSHQKLIEDELFEINRKALWEEVKEHYDSYSKSKKKQIKKRIRDFSPSGIALDRKGRYFIISARGSTLAVFNSDGTLDDIHLLNEEILPQPEGITFDANQNLYISTEGKSLLAKIAIYQLKKK